MYNMKNAEMRTNIMYMFNFREASFRLFEQRVQPVPGERHLVGRLLLPRGRRVHPHNLAGKLSFACIKYIIFNGNIIYQFDIKEWEGGRVGNSASSLKKTQFKHICMYIQN